MEKRNKGEKLTSEDQDLLNHLSTHDLPSQGEYHQLRDFLQYLLDNHKVIDPLDTQEQLKDVQLLTTEVVDMLFSGQGCKPEEVVNLDMPVKLANYVIEQFVEPIRDDRLFRKRGRQNIRR